MFIVDVTPRRKNELKIYARPPDIIPSLIFANKYPFIFKSVFDMNDMHCILAHKPPKDKRKVIDAIIIGIEI